MDINKIICVSVCVCIRTSLIENFKKKNKTEKKPLRVKGACEILDEVTREGFTKGDFKKTKNCKEVGKLAMQKTRGRTFEQSEKPLKSSCGRSMCAKSRGSEKANVAGME